MHITQDHNGFLTPENSQQQNGKVYTRIFGSSVFESCDHEVLLFEKGKIVSKSWKDIGPGQQALRVVQPQELEQDLSQSFFRVGFFLLYKIDENTGNKHFLQKYDIFLTQYMESLLRNNWLSPESVGSISMISPDIHFSSFVSFLFGLACGHGKWMLKDKTLFPIKITLPLTSSLIGERAFFENHLQSLCRIYEIYATFSFQSTQTYELCTITLHDHRVLSLFINWLNPLVSVHKISTLETAYRAYNALVVYAQQNTYGLSLAGPEYLQVLPLQ